MKMECNSNYTEYFTKAPDSGHTQLLNSASSSYQMKTACACKICYCKPKNLTPKI